MMYTATGGGMCPVGTVAACCSQSRWNGKYFEKSILDYRGKLPICKPPSGRPLWVTTLVGSARTTNLDRAIVLVQLLQLSCVPS
jgi:hypothetical protein